MGKLFGTDGIRGVVNDGLDAMLAFRVGMAAAQVMTREKGGGQPRFTIGKDTRISSDLLEGALIAPAYDMTGSYNIAWIIAAALSIAMTAFLLYSYRVSRICIKGQEETGNTAKIQYNNGKMR